jgi:hypothetical protein
MWEADMRAGVRASVKLNTTQPGGCHVNNPQTARQDHSARAPVDVKIVSSNEVNTNSKILACARICFAFNVHPVFTLFKIECERRGVEY